jgi:hypothetical protein
VFSNYVLLIFLVFILLCPIMFLYVLSSLLSCSLRFPHIFYVRFVFTSSCLYEGHVLFTLGLSLPPVVCMRVMSYLRYLCLLDHSGVQHICCVFMLFSFVLGALCCQFRRRTDNAMTKRKSTERQTMIYKTLHKN